MLSQLKDRVARRNKHTNSPQPSPAHSNRLTKPRTSSTTATTISKSPSPVFTPDSPLPESPHYSDLSAQSRQHIKEWILTPNDKDIDMSLPVLDKDMEAGELATDSRGRLSFVLSRNNSKTNSRANSKQPNSVSNSRSNSLSFFGRRHSSANTSSMHDSRSHIMSGSQVDVEAAIRLLQEVKKSASPEDLAAIREALEPTTDAMVDDTTDAATSTPSSGASRRTSGVSSSLSSLMRRRSMVQTPGVATRSSPVDNRRTWNSWRTPQLNAEQEAKWRTPAKQTSIGNLAVPDLAEDARAQTPGSLDYSHLGTYRPGTLMVTNGPPSPAASSVHISRHNSSMDDSNENDNDDNYDYFASGSGHFTTTRTSRSQSHARSQSSNAPEAAYPSQLNKHRLHGGDEEYRVIREQPCLHICPAAPVR
jgi:hypothetical protein